MSELHYTNDHKRHLCYLVAREGILMEEDLKTLVDLVSEANFVCSTCGRSAKKAENLCHPIKL
ncbi:MAG: hypothetical protein ACFFCW_31725 [Candidatus Hodarchaeota archaeon]